MSEFSDNLTKLRIEEGLTQRDLAQILEVAPSIIHYWETGRNEPKLHYIVELCKYFNVPFEEFTNCKYSELESLPLTKKKWFDKTKDDKLKCLLNENEFKVIRLFNSICVADQEKVLTAMELYSNDWKNEPPHHKKTVYDCSETEYFLIEAFRELSPGQKQGLLQMLNIDTDEVKTVKRKKSE